MNPRLLALVVVGGAVGTAVRALLEHAYPAPAGAWPSTTFTINVTGSFVLGLLLQRLARGGPDEGRRRTLRLGVGTGVLGGYTTYSSFAVESVQLGDSGRAGLAVAYALGSVAAGLLAAGAAMVIGDALARRRDRAA